MRKGRKKIKCFLALALVICIPVAFTFFHYYSLSIGDFLSSQLKFEARDQISLPSVCDDKFKTFGLTGLDHLFFLDNKVFKQISVISFQIATLELITFILRC